MKTEIKTTQPEFTPFEITLTVETEREALMLLALTNEDDLLTSFLNESAYVNARDGIEEFNISEVERLTKIWGLIHTKISKP